MTSLKKWRIISVGVSITRKQDRNADGVAAEKPRRRRRCGKAKRLQETKTGETAGKVAETANGWAKYDIGLPQSIIESFARFLVPEMKKYYAELQEQSKSTQSENKEE